MVIREEDIVSTVYAWSEIDRITVRGLPAGATLRIAVAPGAYEAVPDPVRPVIDARYRGLTFPLLGTAQTLYGSLWILMGFTGTRLYNVSAHLRKIRTGKKQDKYYYPAFVLPCAS